MQLTREQNCVAAQWVIESQNYPNRTIGFRSDGSSFFAAQIVDKLHR